MGQTHLEVHKKKVYIVLLRINQIIKNWVYFMSRLKGVASLIVPCSIHLISNLNRGSYPRKWQIIFLNWDSILNLETLVRLRLNFLKCKSNPNTYLSPSLCFKWYPYKPISIKAPDPCHWVKNSWNIKKGNKEEN